MVVCSKVDCQREVWTGGKCKTCYHRDYFYVRKQRFFDFLGGECVECGSTSNLEIDHVDPALKTLNFSANLSISNAAVQQELQNAQLLCETCHLKKTIREKKPFAHGTLYGWMKAKCKCSVCEQTRRAWNDARNAKRRKPGGRGPYRKTK